MKLRNLKFIFIIFVMLISINFVSSEETDVFVIHLKYLRENISLESISLVKMNYFPPKSIQEGRYKIDMVSNSKEILFSQKFDFSLEIFGASDQYEKSIFEGGEIIILDEATKELVIPYSLKAKKLVVYDEDKLILEYGLSEYTGVEGSRLDEIESNHKLIYLLVGIILVLIIFFVIILFLKLSNN